MAPSTREAADSWRGRPVRHAAALALIVVRMPTRPAAPRSLADDLRARDDAQLVVLLRARPDLATPVPADVTSLAARATTRASVQRALDGVDAFTLQVVDGLAVLPEPTSRTRLAKLLGVKAAAVVEPLERLRDLALVWGPDADLRLVRTVRDTLGHYPAGLGTPIAELLERRDLGRVATLAREYGLDATGPDVVTALAAHLSDPAVVLPLLEGAPPEVRSVLDRLTWGPPVGAVPRADRSVDRQSASSPVEWLLARGLLGVADAGHVVLPREVGIALRGGRVHERPATEPPPPDTVDRTLAAVDAGAGSQAGELLRLVDELLQAWGLAPPPVLRSGGLGVRDLRRTAATLDVDETITAAVIELAYAAGLVADDGELAPTWAPTPASDLWLDDDPAGRWALLARTWLATTRTPGLVGSRDDRNAMRGALSPDVDRPASRTVRAFVLAELADVRAGHALTPASLRERLQWRRPRRTGRFHDDLVTWTLRETELLGVTSRGAMSTPGRALLADDPAAPASRDRLARAMGALLPEPVDHLLLQADLTAVAPGPLEPVLARAMTLAADVESRGGATVYRFSPTSVRRALDAGWSARDLIDLLSARSRTPMPQPLEYLVGDVARRHGQVRVGGAGAYIRSDDESVLTELLGERKAAPLQLRRLAPTVLVAAADPPAVLSVLRQLGLAPAAESPEGAVVVRRPDARRTPPRQPPRPSAVGAAAPSPALLEAVVRTLRLGQTEHDEQRLRAAAVRGPALAATDPSVTLATLREAAARRQRVWIGYVDGAGRVERRVVEPLSVEGGRVTAFDTGSDEVRSFSVHRVTGVAAADEPA